MNIILRFGLLLGLLGWLSAVVIASELPRPNILFVIADDWGFGHAGAYGCKWVKTPAFDRVADQGILFSAAYTPNAKCAPSRAIILTGRNSWQLKAAANHGAYFPPEFKTFMEALNEQGWFVGHTAKGWGPGIATNNAGKPREMTGASYNGRKAKSSTSGISTSDYAANFADFLDASPKGKPWCFWFGALEPHRGYEYGSGVAKGGKRTSDVDRVPGFWPDNETTRNDMLDYAFEVEHFDQHLGRMLAELERRGWLDNTLVVVTSDHGMPFPRVKGQAYEMSNHIPLAMMWKDGLRKPGRKVSDIVSFVDLAPTFIEVAGLKWEQTGMATAAGRSLTDILLSEKSGIVNPARDHMLIGKERHDVGRPHDWGYPMRGII
jgi:arylsulfatase A-like enzyme